MNPELLLGIGLIAIGAGMSGSFSIPFTKTKGWAWENYWLAYSLFAYIIFPIVACLIFCPDFLEVMKTQSSQSLWSIFIYGVIYGLANLSFGLSLKYLGLSLGFSISLGMMMVLGTITPPILDGRLSKMLESDGITMLIAGLVVATIGVAITAISGMKKEKAQGTNNADFNFTKGIFAAVFVGLTGSAQALGIEQGNAMAESLVESGVNSLFGNVPTFLILYAGSFLITMIWCIYASLKNKTIKAYVSSDGTNSVSINYIFCSLAGLLWFINYVFLGMGKSRMGEFSFTAFGISMSFTIACGTLWGFYRGEWKGVDSKIKQLMYIGLITLFIASFIIGMSSN